MKLKTVLGILTILLLLVFFGIVTHQEFIHVDLNSKQVMLIYWKERLAGLLLIILAIFGLVFMEE